jgi:hypothetical protein
MSFANVTEFKYLGMLVKNMVDEIWVIQMPKNSLEHLVFCILLVRPLAQKFMYQDVCEAFILLLRKKENITV